MNRYEEIQRLRNSFNHDENVIMIEEMRNKYVKEGKFKDAFRLQQKLEDEWFNLINKENNGKERN